MIFFSEAAENAGGRIKLLHLKYICHNVNEKCQYGITKYYNFLKASNSKAIIFWHIFCNIPDQWNILLNDLKRTDKFVEGAVIK